MRNKIQPDRSRNPMRTALAILLAVSMVLGGTITDGWLPSYAEDALSALGIRNRNEVSGQLLTAEGNDYTIHLDYKEDILPEHATLTAEELLPETEIYGKLAAPDPETEPFRLFKITVTADGADLEPAEQATATVTWKNTPATSLAGRESVSLYDAHAAEESTNPEATDAAAIITDNGDGNTAITFSMKAPAIVKLPAAPAPTATAQDTEAAENQNTPAATTGTGETEAVTEQTAGAEIAALTGGDALLNTNGENAVPSLLSMEGTRNAPLLAASKSTEYTVEVGKKISIEGKTSDKSHSWSSENKDIAKVTGSGNVCEVTGVSAGTVVITHTYKKDKTETFTIVVEPSASKVSLLTVTPSELTVTEGATETIDVTTDGCTVSSAVSSDESIATATLSENVITINGIQTGSTTITMTGEPLTGYSAPESKTITVTVVSGEERGSYTDEESTAQPSQTSDLKVSVKATGNWKKLSDYHVVVKNADQDYGGETGFLKAYHIYLADENNEEVPSEKLKNGGKNLNLQVTLTYDNPPSWLAQAKDIKHYKGKTDRTEQYIKNIKIDAEKGTVSFMVHGFSDFVITSTGSSGTSTVSTVAGSILYGFRYNDANAWQIVSGKYENNDQSHKNLSTDGNLRIQKNVIPTGIEDEFYVYLSVDAKTYQIVRTEQFNEYIKNADHYIAYSANSGGAIGDLGKPKGAIKEGELVRVQLTLKYKNEEVGYGEVVTGVPNCHIYLKVGEKYITLANIPNGVDTSKPYPLTVTLSDNAYSALYDSVVKTSSSTTDQTAFTESSSVTVTDRMGDYIVNEGVLDGKANGTVTSDKNGITWSLQGKENPEKTSVVEETTTYQDGNKTVTRTVKTYWNLNVAELVYKVRLNTEKAGFSSGQTYNVNDSATISYQFDGETRTATFPVPMVKGQLYYLEIEKTDADDVNKKLNAGFTLSGTSGCGTSVSKAGTTNNNGFLLFGPLSWGTYTLSETSVPDGYERTYSDTAYKIGTTGDGTGVWQHDTVESENGQTIGEGVGLTGNNRITNKVRPTPITGLSINTASGRMVATGVAFAGLLVLMWVVRRRMTRFM